MSDLPKRVALRTAFASVGLDDVAAALAWLQARGVHADRTEAYVVRRQLLKATAGDGTSPTNSPPGPRAAEEPGAQASTGDDSTSSQSPTPTVSAGAAARGTQQPGRRRDKERQSAEPAPAERRPRTAIPVPGEGDSFSARIALTTTAAHERALKVARLEDRIPVNARIRAMIALYLQDETYRRRVDRIARSWRG